jgi:hypothetical protein
MSGLLRSIAAIVAFVAASVTVFQYFSGSQYFNEWYKAHWSEQNSEMPSNEEPVAVPDTVGRSDEPVKVEDVPEKPSSGTAEVVTGSGYRLLQNSRGFSLSIPDEFLQLEKGDNSKFEVVARTDDKQGVIILSFISDELASKSEGVSAAYEQRLLFYGLKDPEYSRKADGYFVLSDYEGEMEFYECNSRFRSGSEWGWARFVIKYPRELGSRFEPHIQTMFQSFRDSTNLN